MFESQEEIEQRVRQRLFNAKPKPSIERRFNENDEAYIKRKLGFHEKRSE